MINYTVLQEEDESDYQTKESAQCRSQTLLPVLPGRGSEQPFRGLLASQLQCTKCAHKVSNFQYWTEIYNGTQTLSKSSLFIVITHYEM